MTDPALAPPRGLDDPWTRFKLRAAGAVVILLLSVVGIAFIDMNSERAFAYWVGLTVVSGLICMGLAALSQRGQGGQLAMVGRQAVHWLGLLVALWLLFYLFRIEFVQAQDAAVFAVLLLVLTTWHAGTHFDPVFILISVALAAVAYINAFVEQYMILVTIPILLVIAGLVLWGRYRHSRAA
jgi:hypothetical protein